MIREGSLPLAILNGKDDPFLNHGYIAGLDFGRLWTGAPHDIPAGKHAPFFNEADRFNHSLRTFMHWAEGPTPVPGGV